VIKRTLAGTFILQQAGRWIKEALVSLVLIFTCSAPLLKASAQKSLENGRVGLRIAGIKGDTYLERYEA